MQRILSNSTGFLYTKAMKPWLFKFDPESVHNTMVKVGSQLAAQPIIWKLMKGAWSYQSQRTMKKIDGITFPNPVGLAAGFDYNGDMVESAPGIGFGFHTIGTVTLEAYDGNPPPRLTRLPNSKSIIVNKGLKNIGAAAIIKKLESQPFKIPTGFSIASTNKLFKNESDQIKEICDCFRLFESSKLQPSYYELNISCPNTFGGEPFTTPLKLERLMTQFDKLKISKPVYVKMPIDFSESETLQLLKVLSLHNVQGVVFGNLTKDKTNPDVQADDLARWKQQPGNLSGKPTWKRSNACIALTKKHFDSRFTIIGTGGIFSGADAEHKLKLGADLVQLITGIIYKGPQLVGQINHYLDTSK